MVFLKDNCKELCKFFFSSSLPRNTEEFVCLVETFICQIANCHRIKGKLCISKLRKFYMFNLVQVQNTQTDLINQHVIVLNIVLRCSLLSMETGEIITSEII